jgi:hypothetical protein
MTETQQRFLKAIAERVTGDNVTEIRLYPTVRVGPVESGVAIVATKEPMPMAVADEQVSAEEDVTVDADCVRAIRPAVDSHRTFPAYGERPRSRQVGVHDGPRRRRAYRDRRKRRAGRGAALW